MPMRTIEMESAQHAGTGQRCNPREWEQCHLTWGWIVTNLSSCRAPIDYAAGLVLVYAYAIWSGWETSMLVFCTWTYSIYGFSSSVHHPKDVASSRRRIKLCGLCEARRAAFYQCLPTQSTKPMLAPGNPVQSADWRPLSSKHC